MTRSTKNWLWYFIDEYGPRFGHVIADSKQAAERLVRVRLTEECVELPTEIHIQECEDSFTMAKGYL